METNETINCPNCKAVLNKGAKFCNGCGAQISAPKKNDKPNMMYSGAFIIIPLIIIVAVVFFIVNHKKDMSNQEFKHPTVEGASGLMPDFDEVVANLPTDYAGLVERGNFFMDRSMYSLAIECYTRATAIDETDPNVLTDLGTCYYSGGDNDKALQIFLHVIDKFPEHKIAYLNLGVVYFNKEDIDNTIHYWNELIDRFPDDPIADTVKIYIEQLKQHP
ncbi:MAG: tetratricopeptide repeat protein [Candidatus Zixiibacteriota bacterium]